MAAQHIEPHLVMADERGNIYDDPDLLMVCRRGAQWGLPRPDELIPLPEQTPPLSMTVPVEITPQNL